MSDVLSKSTSVLPVALSDDSLSLVYEDTQMNSSIPGRSALTSPFPIKDSMFDSLPHDLFTLQLLLLNIFQLTKLSLDKN